MKILKYLLLTLFLYMSAVSCLEDVDKIAPPPTFVLAQPADGSKDVMNSTEVSITYDQQIKLSEVNTIKINGQPVQATVQGAKILLKKDLDKGTEYVVKVPAGIVFGVNGDRSADEVVFKFSTKKETRVLSVLPVMANASREAVNVYEFLKEVYGSKCISSSMANVSWNTNEADWVFKHTGKYPAINTFDYIHLNWAPDSWIDYSNTQAIENWWANNGIVSAMWHWKVPKNKDTTDKNEFTYASWETSFKAANATVEGTWENEVVKADLKEMAGYLKLLKDKNIPVVWRPLHEASGNIYKGGGAWFWWGAGGSEAFKKLWIYMFDYFEQQGLNNLIWVWTTEMKDDAFYPGDQYVDIVGRDIYGNSDSSNIAGQFNAIQQTYPTKMIALSEMGGLPTISQQWSSGAFWSYFMPWYDYDRTVNPNSAAFTETSHGSADIAWWKDAFKNEAVISRDEIPNLK